MTTQIIAAVAILVQALFLLAHRRYDHAIRSLLPTTLSDEDVVNQYHRLDLQRMGTGMGVIACLIICATLWISPTLSGHWSSQMQTVVKIVSCAMTLFCYVIVLRYNFDRDGRC